MRQWIQAGYTHLFSYSPGLFSRQFTAGKSKASDWLFHIANAVAYMENIFLNPVAISSVASIAYFSTRYFVRIFKSNYNVSPKEYLMGLRLNHARRLICSNMKLSLIAMESGFSDTSHFSRQFKARYGISPGEYRKNQRKIFLYSLQISVPIQVVRLQMLRLLLC